MVIVKYSIPYRGFTMMTDEMKYAASLESVKSWNAKMMMDRKMRQPYLDNTTGLAQTNCHLWMSKLDRNPGIYLFGVMALDITFYEGLTLFIVQSVSVS